MCVQRCSHGLAARGGNSDGDLTGLGRTDHCQRVAEPSAIFSVKEALFGARIAGAQRHQFTGAFDNNLNLAVCVGVHAALRIAQRDVCIAQFVSGSEEFCAFGYCVQRYDLANSLNQISSRFNTGGIKEMLIALPPISEQRRIEEAINISGISDLIVSTPMRTDMV